MTDVIRVFMFAASFCVGYGLTVWLGGIWLGLSIAPLGFHFLYLAVVFLLIAGILALVKHYKSE